MEESPSSFVNFIQLKNNSKAKKQSYLILIPCTVEEFKLTVTDYKSWGRIASR